MTKMWTAVLTAAMMLGAGNSAFAQDAMHGDAMHGDAMHAMSTMPTMVCRAAAKGETPSATLASGGAIVCKNVDMAKMLKGPAMPANTTKTDEDAAWHKELMLLQLPLNGAPS